MIQMFSPDHQKKNVAKSKPQEASVSTFDLLILSSKNPNYIHSIKLILSEHYVSKVSHGSSSVLPYSYTNDLAQF